MWREAGRQERLAKTNMLNSYSSCLQKEVYGLLSLISRSSFDTREKTFPTPLSEEFTCLRRTNQIIVPLLWRGSDSDNQT